MILPALATVAAAYAAFVGWCAWRVSRAPGASGGAPGAPPRVAVLVAARDEEATIGRCLEALLAQDYPAGRIEIVVADDHSTDETDAVVARYVTREAVPERAGAFALAGEAPPAGRAPEASVETAAARQRPRVRYVRVPDPTGHVRGKALAIHTAVEATDVPLLLVTDADCAPPPGWARALAADLQRGAALTGGLTLMEERTATDTAQSLDWGFLLGVASAMTEAGFPATAMGNNLGFTREAYEAVGGYPGLPFSVTEDYALFKAIAEREGTDRVRFPIRPASLVRTLPARSLGHAYRQRRRWARGGMRAGPTVWAAYVLAHVAHLVPLVGLALAPLAGLGALAVKLGADALHLRAVLAKGGAGPLRLAPFLLFEGFLFLYMATLPAALLLAPRIRWKGRRH